MTLSLSPKIRIIFHKYLFPYVRCIPCCYGYIDISETEPILPIITKQPENKVMVDKSNQIIIEQPENKVMVDKSNQTEDDNFDWDVL